MKYMKQIMINAGNNNYKELKELSNDRDAWRRKETDYIDKATLYQPNSAQSPTWFFDRTKDVIGFRFALSSSTPLESLLRLGLEFGRDLYITNEGA
ncbi:Hypothetical protein CINCED_3A015012, partial [Cinara cedri]